MSKNKWMSQMYKMDAAVDPNYNFYIPENVVRTKSPSINWTFGKGGGLPFGFGLLLYGKPKSGKSLTADVLAAGVHQQDPEGIVVKFDTEHREDNTSRAMWGVDDSRYMAFNTNEPKDIFDKIHDEFVPMLEAGFPLRMIIIDSVSGVEGVKAKNAASVEDHQMGDKALTIGKGLTRILPIIRKYKIALVCCEHVRANLNAGAYGPKEKMAGAWAEKHFFEYYMEVKADGSAEGKKTITGDKFEGDIKDAKGNKEQTARKVWVKMVDNTKSFSGRTVRVTFSRSEGLAHVEDELFELGWGLGIIEKSGSNYTLNGQTFHGKPKTIAALKENKELADYIVQFAYDRDNPTAS